MGTGVVDGRKVRSFTRLAITIIVAAVVVSASLLSYSALEATTTTTTETTTSSSSLETVPTPVTTTTSTATISSTASTSSAAAPQSYKVTFQQSGDCAPTVYIAPWAVTVGNEVGAQPANATLPILSGGFGSSPEYANESSIVLYLSSGTYTFKLSPAGAFVPNSGNFTVYNSSLQVLLQGPVVSCSTTTDTTMDSMG